MWQHTLALDLFACALYVTTRGVARHAHVLHSRARIRTAFDLAIHWQWFAPGAHILEFGRENDVLTFHTQRAPLFTPGVVCRAQLISTGVLLVLQATAVTVAVRDGRAAVRVFGLASGELDFGPVA